MVVEDLHPVCLDLSATSQLIPVSRAGGWGLKGASPGQIPRSGVVLSSPGLPAVDHSEKDLPGPHQYRDDLSPKVGPSARLYHLDLPGA